MRNASAFNSNVMHDTQKTLADISLQSGQIARPDIRRNEASAPREPGFAKNARNDGERAERKRTGASSKWLMSMIEQLDIGRGIG